MAQLASHNSWTFLTPRKWWMRLIAFTARCQRLNIRQQFWHGVRCFDLRIRFDEQGLPVIAHGIVEYDYATEQIMSDLNFLNIMARTSNVVYVRLINEVRKEADDTETNRDLFSAFCKRVEEQYESIRFWNGSNLLSKRYCVYHFVHDASCEELYSSVRSPKLLDDWWPWLYASLHNRGNWKRGTDKAFMMMDFVDLI